MRQEYRSSHCNKGLIYECQENVRKVMFIIHNLKLKLHCGASQDNVIKRMKE